MTKISIQNVVHKLETNFFQRLLWCCAGGAAILALIVLYDLRAYRNFAAPEAMDAAQVARNLSAGHGFSTEFICPFSLYLIQTHNPKKFGSPTDTDSNSTNNSSAFGQPDLANAPVYPLALAGLMRVLRPDWTVQLNKSFWSEGGSFRRYKPEFEITLFNQMLLVTVVVLTFFIARKLFDSPVAWIAAILTLGSNLLWKFSVSGLSTLLLLTVFLALFWCLLKFEELGRAESPSAPKLFIFVIFAGLILGLGMITRYAFGWLLLPTLVFLLLFGGQRRTNLAITLVLSFAVIVTPWIVRNFIVSGTPFGTAGYAITENSVFPSLTLLQTPDPHLNGIIAFHPYWGKLLQNVNAIFQNDLLRLGEGWGGILFFAGLLLGLRHPAARRLRYFVLLCLGTLIVVQALGKTYLSDATPDLNTENLLVLLTPLIFIFGTAFFLTLVEQMKLPFPAMRYLVIVLVCSLICRSLVWTIYKGNSPVSSPYFPPEIQKVGGWMKPNELMMSDVPWAVAWYGDQQCVWTTPDTQTEFFALNDYYKPVHALYLSRNTLNAQLFNDCLQGDTASWPNFTFTIAKTGEPPKGFPLRLFSSEPLAAGLFLTDRPR